MSLDRLAESARRARPDWDDHRASRVLASTIAVREGRVARTRAARRTIAVIGAGALVFYVLLRGAITPADASTSTEAPAPTVLAAHGGPLEHIGDGGYARD